MPFWSSLAGAVKMTIHRQLRGTKIRKEKEEGLKRDLAQDADVEFLANGEE